MNMGATSTGMAMSPTMSMGSAASASSTAMSMDDMGMGACKINMLWNWYTIDASPGFISTSWRITSTGMFAGSCIGVILLVVVLEFLRRVQREYDAYLTRQNQKDLATTTTVSGSESPSPSVNKGAINTILNKSGPQQRLRTRPAALLQRQFLRALIHMLQFGVAYMVMLLAMYYNGYFIICILIGAFIGSFIFSWDQLFDTSWSVNYLSSGPGSIADYI